MIWLGLSCHYYLVFDNSFFKNEKYQRIFVVRLDQIDIQFVLCESNIMYTSYQILAQGIIVYYR
jgi:hypothetical protein